MSAPEPTSTATPARGQRLARDERRAQVLAVAQELFSVQGYHHVSMDDIADSACVGKPVLYRHFPSKLDLYLAVVDQRGAQLLAAVDEAVAPLLAGLPSPDGRRVVGAVVRAYFGFVDVAGASSSLLFESDVTHDAAVRARVESASQEVAVRVAGVLVEAAGLGAPQARLVATALITLTEGAATQRWRTPDGIDAEEAAELITTLLWEGISGVMAQGRARS